MSEAGCCGGNGQEVQDGNLSYILRPLCGEDCGPEIRLVSDDNENFFGYLYAEGVACRAAPRPEWTGVLSAGTLTISHEGENHTTTWRGYTPGDRRKFTVRARTFVEQGLSFAMCVEPGECFNWPQCDNLPVRDDYTTMPPGIDEAMQVQQRILRVGSGLLPASDDEVWSEGKYRYLRRRDPFVTPPGGDVFDEVEYYRNDSLSDLLPDEQFQKHYSDTIPGLCGTPTRTVARCFDTSGFPGAKTSHYHNSQWYQGHPGAFIKAANIVHQATSVPMRYLEISQNYVSGPGPAPDYECITEQVWKDDTIDFSWTVVNDGSVPRPAAYQLVKTITQKSYQYRQVGDIPASGAAHSRKATGECLAAENTYVTNIYIPIHNPKFFTEITDGAFFIDQTRTHVNYITGVTTESTVPFGGWGTTYPIFAGPFLIGNAYREFLGQGISLVTPPSYYAFNGTGPTTFSAVQPTVCNMGSRTRTGPTWSFTQTFEGIVTAEAIA